MQTYDYFQSLINWILVKFYCLLIHFLQMRNIRWICPVRLRYVANLRSDGFIFSFSQSRNLQETAYSRKKSLRVYKVPLKAQETQLSTTAFNPAIEGQFLRLQAGICDI